MADQRVRGHDRYTAAGKTRVRAHSRNAEAWKEAGKAWAFTAAGAVTSVALVVQMGFQLISTITIIITAVLTVVAGHATKRAAQGPKRRTASKNTRPKAKPRPRSNTGSLWQHIERKQARRRARVRKLKRRGKKVYKHTRTVVVTASRWSRAAYRKGRAAYVNRKATRNQHGSE